MRVLVTGSSGFIGTPVVSLALEAGDSVMGLDFKAPRRTDYEHFDVDVRDGEAVAQCIEQARPDVVIHLAALHYIPYCNAHPDETTATNVGGTMNVLEACGRVDVTRFFFASTAAVYRPAAEAHAESAAVLPVDLYGLSKAFGEQLVRSSETPDMAIAIGRIFNVYGPGDPHPHVIPDLVGQVKAQESDGSLHVQLGNLTPARDYVHVSDAAVAVYRMATGGIPSGTLNIGSGEATSVEQLVGIFEEVSQRSIEVEQAQERMRTVDRPMLRADIAQLRAHGWVAQVELADGIRSLLQSG